MSRRDGEAPRPQAESDTSRLETFSDGVMAIAITLLILDVKVPHLQHGLWHALVEQWPSYAAFATSFLTIGIIWANHHRMFKLIARTTNAFLMINVLFLLVISFIPFPTAVVAAYLRDPEQRRTAALVYGGTMVLTAVMFNVLWGYASRDGRLLTDGFDRQAIVRGTKSYRLGPVVYLAATLVALWNGLVSLGLFMAIAVYWMFPASGPG